jgi:uncharacterized protein
MSGSAPRREGEADSNAEWEYGDAGQQMNSDKHQHPLLTPDSNVQRWLACATGNAAVPARLSGMLAFESASG